MKISNLISYVITSTLLLNMFPITATSAGPQKKIKIHGYVTNILSPNSFEIEDYKIMKDQEFVLEFENQGTDVSFNLEDIRIGTEIEVQGMINPETGELKAKKITVDLDQFRKLQNTSVLNAAPIGIQRVGNGWSGILKADGRRIRLDPTATKVLFEMTKEEKKGQEKAAKELASKKKESKDANATTQTSPETKVDGIAPNGDEVSETEPLRDISQIKPGMYMTYEGREDLGGVVNAEQIIFRRNELEKGELSFWKSLSLSVKASDYSSGKPGELKINKLGKYKLLPNQAVQDYVTNLGNKLIPAFQKNLPISDPSKINFRFFVVINKEPNAFALANGTIVVHSGMITLLENEAQLAAVLSHEMAHSTQEHSWRAINKDKGKRTALQIGAIAASAFGWGGVSDILNLTINAMVNGYSRRLENQADRIGLEYLVASGYDPREAPKVWKVMANTLGDSPTNFFYSSHDSHSTRRSFLMVEIRNNYSGLDVNSMKRDSGVDYKSIVTLTNEAVSKKKKIKVQS